MATSFAFASSSGITYHGRIIKPDETPLEGDAVQFRLQIRTPGNENCLLYEETKTIDMRNSNGVVSITVNDGNGTRSDSSGFNFDQVFANRGTFTFSPSQCSTGSVTTSYTPNESDGRRFQIFFRPSTSVAWEPLPSTALNFVPMAIEAKQIGGFSAKSLLRVADASGPQLAPVLTPANATELVALVGGTSALYTKAGQLNGIAIPTSYAANESIRWNGSTWEKYTALSATDVQTFAKTALPVCAVGEILTSDGTTLGCVTDGAGAIGDATTSTKGIVAVGASGGIAVSGGTLTLATTGVAAGTYTKISVDVTGRVLTGTTLVAADIPSLDASKITSGTFTTAQIPSLDASKITTGTFATAGMVSGDAITSGTIGGSTAMVTSGAVSANSLTSKSIYVWDSDSSNSVQIVAPATASLTANYVLTLPTTDGSTGEVLQTDGSGNLSWVSASAGSVTNVGLSLPSIFSVSGGPVTSSGTFNATLASQSANTVFAAPDGSGGTPTFRSLASGDIPSLDAAKIATGTFMASQIPSLDASKVTTGTFAVGRIPALDAAQITTGTFASSLIPALGAAQIPNLDASKITTGTFSPALIPDLDAAKITSGTLAIGRIPALDASNVATGTFAASQIPVLDASKVGTGTFTAAQIPSLDASKITTGTITNTVNNTTSVSTRAIDVYDSDSTNKVTIVTPATGSLTADYTLMLPVDDGTNGQVLTTNGSGALTWSSAAIGSVTSVDVNLPSIFTMAGGPITAAGTISATLASQAANSFWAAPNGAPGAPTFRAMVAADVPALDAAKITTGTFTAAQIPDLDSAKIATGTLNVARIPDLDAAKITTGTLSVARIPDLDAAKTATGTFAVARIPALDAANVPTGTFAAGQIPSLDASKISTGTITNTVRNTSSVGTRAVEVYDSDSTNKVTIVTPATGSLTADYTLTLPVDDGTNGQVLTTNGSGALTWSSAAIGSVTSVDVNLPSIFTMAGGPITAAGTISATLASQAANSFWAAPNGAPGAPTFRAMVAADVPALDAAKITTGTFTAAQIPDLDSAKIASGTLAVARIPDLDAAKTTTGTFAVARIPALDAAKITTGSFATAQIPDLDASKIASGSITNPISNTSFVATRSMQVFDSDSTNKVTIQTPATGTLTSDYVLTLPVDDGTNGQILTTDGNGVLSWVAAGGAGTVTNVGLALPNIFSVAGGPVTTNGTFTATLTSQTQNTFWAAPDGSGGAPTFRAMVAADVPALDAAKITTGTFATAQIPDLDAAKIASGTLAVARIPALDAAKIASGTFTTAGMVSGASITSGTIGGSTAIATSGNISSNNVTSKGFYVWDSDATNSILIQSPATGSLTSNYVLTLPADDGAANQVLQTDGSGNLTWVNQTSTGSGTFRADGGTAAIPAFSFSGDTNTGMYNVAPDTLGFTTNSTNRVVIDALGNVGIGTTSPQNPLDVTGNARINGRVYLANGSSMYGHGGYANTTVIESSNANTSTSLFVRPNGSGGTAELVLLGNGFDGTSALAQIAYDANHFVIGNPFIAHPIDFNQLGTMQMRISANGRIGVGTTDPQTKLDVLGAITANIQGTATGQGGEVRFQELAAGGSNYVALRAPDAIGSNITLTLPTSAGTLNQVLTTDGSGALSWTTVSGAPTGTFLANNGTAAAPTFSFTGDPNTGMYNVAADTLGFSTNNTTRLAIDPSGNVGIGTTVPSERLTIGGYSNNADTYMNIRTQGGGAAKKSGIKLRAMDDNYGFDIIHDDGSSPVGLNVIRHENSAAGTSALFINRLNGNIGIGTTAPATTLDVNGIVKIGSGTCSAATQGSLQFTSNSVQYCNTSNVWTTLAAGTPSQWTTNGSAVGYTGPVGIGTTSPLALELHVADPSGTTSQIKLSNNTGSTASDGIDIQFTNNDFWIQNNEGGRIDFTTTSTSRLTIAPSGNVGVGTTNPTAAKFNVVSNSGSGDVIAIQDTGSGGFSEIKYLDSDGTDGGWIGHDNGNDRLFINTAGARSFSLATHGGTSERMRIDAATGNVGIGTSAPSAKLDVNGSIKIGTGTCGASTQGSLQFTSNSIQYCNTSNAWTTLGTGGGDVTRGGNTQGSGVMTVGTNDAYPLGLEANGTTRMTILASGELGVGTTNPSFTLDVQGTAVPIRAIATRNSNAAVTAMNLDVQNSSGAGGTGLATTITFRGETTTSTGQDMADVGAIWTDGTHASRSAALTFSTVNNAGSLAERMRILHSGNVGIGTTNPAAALDVNGSIKIGTGTCGASTQGSLQFTSNSIQYCNTSNAWTTLGTGGGDVVRGGNTQGSGVMTVGTNDAFALGLETNGTTRMTFDSSGFVGIGNANPNANLDILGNVVGDMLVNMTNSNSAGYTTLAFNNNTGMVGEIFVNGSTNGNYAGANSLNLGSFVNAPMALYTNSTERIRISPTGNVGVGTNNPSGKFSVASAAGEHAYLFYDNANIGDANDGQSLYVYRKAAEGNDYFRFYTDQYRNQHLQSSLNMYIAPQNGGGLYLTGSSGNYVPTTTGRYAPDLAGPFIETTTNLDNSGAMIVLTAKNSSAVSQRGYFGAVSSSSGSSPTLIMGVQTAASAHAERMRIDTSGNMGIGTTAPQTRLDVNGSIKLSTGTCAAATQGSIQFDGTNIQYCNTSNTWTTLSSGSGDVVRGGNTQASGTMLVGTNDAYPLAFETNNTLRMLIDANGNMGIGTATPGSRLQIVTTSTGTTGTINAAESTQFVTPTGATSGATYNSLTGSVYVSNGTTTASLNGFSGWAQASSTSLPSYLKGGYAGAEFSGSRTAGDVMGGQFEVYHTGSGTTTRGIGLNTAVTRTAGAIQSGYGVLIGNVQATAKWSLYAQDSTAPSYFAGNVGIGVTGPATALDVNGTIKLGTGTCGASTQGSLQFASNSIQYCNTSNAWTTLSSGSGDVVRGGNTQGSGTMVVGTNDAYPLAFETNGTSRIHVSTTGNVGIGNTAAGPLHVERNQNAATYAAFMNSNSGTAAEVGIQFINNASSHNFSIGVNSTGYTDPSQAGAAYLWQTNATPMIFATNGSEGMRLASNGNVGIGTTVPAARLDVNGIVKLGTGTCGASTQGSLQFSGGNVQFCNTSNAWTTLSSGGGSGDVVRGGNTQGSGTMVIGTNDAYPLAFETNGTTRMVFDNAGQAAIGRATTDANFNLALGRGTTNYAGMVMYNTTATAGYSIGLDPNSENAFVFNSNTNGWLTLGTAGTERMTIMSTGDVGIGTTVPSAKTHVYSTNSSTSGSVRGGYFEMYPSPGSASTATYRAVHGYNLFSSNTNSPSAVAEGARFQADSAGSGTLGSLRGFAASVDNSATGRVSTATAAYFNVAKSGSGTTNTAYGIYIDSIVATNKFSLWANDSTAPSFFAGNVGIGTTASSEKLEVGGNIRIGQQTARGTTTNRGQIYGSSTFLTTANASTAIDWNNGNIQELATFACDGTKLITMNNMKDGGSYTLLLSGTAAHTGLCNFAGTSLSFKTSGGAVSPQGSRDVMFTFTVINGIVVYTMMDNLQ